MTMIPPHPNLGARNGPAPITTSSWVGRQVLLRRVAAADRRILAGFDQDPTRAPYVQTDGYRHWAAHRAYHPDSPDDFQLAIETRRDQVLVGHRVAAELDHDRTAVVPRQPGQRLDEGPRLGQRGVLAEGGGVRGDVHEL